MNTCVTYGENTEQKIKDLFTKIIQDHDNLHRTSENKRDKKGNRLRADSRAGVRKPEIK